MSIRLLLSTLIIVLLTIDVKATNDIDTTGYHHWAGIGLMAGGLLLSDTEVKQNLQQELQTLFGTTSSNIDDYLAFAPSIPSLLYSLNSNNQDKAYHIRQYLISTGVNLALTYGLKTTLNVRRPNGGGLSFPSGHTSFAFSTATVSYIIYKDKSPIIAWASYIPATITGIMRISRNKHWVPDVLFGAGLGILSSQLTYRIFKCHDKTNTSKQLSNLHFDIGPGYLSLVYHL